MTIPSPLQEHDTSAFNLAVYVLRHADRLSDKTALHVGSMSYSFGEIKRWVAGFATNLTERGFSPGDRIMLRLDNTVEFPIAYLGCIWAGMVPVPCSAMLKAADITQNAQKVAARGIIYDPFLEGGEDAPCDIKMTRSDVSRTRRGAQAEPYLVPANTLAYILFTSGSSGAPKAVAHAHSAILARASMHKGWYGLTEQDRVLHAGAFNWSYTLGTGLLDPWSLGATALIPDPQMSVADLPKYIAQKKVTLFAAVPGIYRQMMRIDFPPMPQLRHGLSAGEALPAQLRRAWRRRTGTDLFEAFGMTECSTFLSGAPTKPAPEDSLGFLQQGRRAAVRSENAAVLPGQTGNLMVHRTDPGLMLGYWSDAGLEPFDAEWFDTGDIMEQRPDGAFLYKGRADDIMNVGGYRLSPNEVELAMQACPDLGELGVSSLEMSAGKKLMIAAYTGSAPVEEVRAYALRVMARYKVPHLWAQIESLPRSANGKLDRKALARLSLWQGQIFNADKP